MDIHKLIDTVAQLNSKIKDLDTIEASKKQVIEDVNNELAKSRLNLENKAKELEKKVEAKLNVLKNLDDELIKNKALLAKINSSQNSVDVDQGDDHAPADQKNNIKLDDSSKTILQESKPKSDLMNGSLEDFIVQQFEKEYQVKYPANSNFRLTDKDFSRVLSTIREKAKPSNNLSILIDEYLSNYSQTLNDSQIKVLEQEKNNSLAL
ncbi:MAG: hypothetical protein RLZZ04_718 [Cyanobacteriota bacterium]|jgi:uncharacterized coiled-coil protein SlyX